jgi:large subunit ribosomal protein L11
MAKEVSGFIKLQIRGNAANPSPPVGPALGAKVAIKEAIKLKSGSAESNRVKVGNITVDQVKAIAEDKMPDLNCFTVESAMHMVAGTARSMGVNVKGKLPEKI